MRAATAMAPARTPPPWLNRLMVVLLRTPGLQRIVGRSTALITFTGRRTGKSYTTPVSYVRQGDQVIITAHRTRQWWRNLLANPHVELRLAGKVFQGQARVSIDSESSLLSLVDFLEAQPAVARVSGVTLDENGHADLEEARRLHAYTAVVEVDLTV